MMSAHYVNDILQKNSRALAWAWATFFLLSIQPLAAQSTVTFEAEIGVKEVVVGLPFELTFILKNGEGSRFTAPAFDDGSALSSRL